MASITTVKAIALGAAMLVFGALATLSADWMNHSLASGSSGAPQPFNHPMIQSFLFFLGLSLTLPVYLVRCCIEKRSPRKLWELPLLIPSSLDVTQTLLMIIGLIWIPASIWQMLNSGILIFGAIFSVLILKKKLSIAHIVAVCFAGCALVAAGASSLLNEQSESATVSKAKFITGIIIVSVAQIVAALHMVTEEKLISTVSVPYEPDHLVGIQGINGMVAMIVLIPIANFIHIDGNRLDDFVEGVWQIYNSLALILFALLFIISVAVFNWAAVEMAFRFSTVHRALVDSCRMSVVWIVCLVVYYAGWPTYGEGWKAWSWLQLVSVVVLTAATFAYNLIPTPTDTETEESSPLLNGKDLAAGSIQSTGGDEESASLLETGSSNSLKNYADSSRE